MWVFILVGLLSGCTVNVTTVDIVTVPVDIQVDVQKKDTE